MTVHSCGKVRYPNRHTAELALTNIRRNGEHRDSTPCRAYPCEWSGA